MSFDNIDMEERRRKWRRSAFWRGVVATVVIISLAIFFILRASDDRPVGPHIARYFLDGIIYDDFARDAFLTEMANNDEVLAVIIRINSPGGTTVGSEALFDSIRQISAQKPVIAVLGEVAASGGYIAAIASDHVIARGNTITGSIGVIMEYPDVTDLMETLGIEMQTIRSSDIKGGPSPFRELTDEARTKEQLMVIEAYHWFRNLVATRRGLNDAALDIIANGGVYSGRQAVENGLIDALGGEIDALVFLESLDPSLIGVPVETWYPVEEETGLLGVIGAKLGINPLLGEITGRSGPRLYSLKR